MENKELEKRIGALEHNFYLIEFNYVKSLISLRDKYGFDVDISYTIDSPFAEEIRKMVLNKRESIFYKIRRKINNG